MIRAWSSVGLRLGGWKRIHATKGEWLEKTGTDERGSIVVEFGLGYIWINVKVVGCQRTCAQGRRGFGMSITPNIKETVVI